MAVAGVGAMGEAIFETGIATIEVEIETVTFEIIVMDPHSVEIWTATGIAGIGILTLETIVVALAVVAHDHPLATIATSENRPAEISI